MQGFWEQEARNCVVKGCSNSRMTHCWLELCNVQYKRELKVLLHNKGVYEARYWTCWLMICSEEFPRRKRQRLQLLGIIRMASMSIGIVQCVVGRKPGQRIAQWWISVSRRSMTSHHNYVMRSDWEIGSINFTIEDFSEMERIPFSLQLHNV